MRIAYVTDVEGQWPKLESFATDNPLVRLDAAGRLQVADGARFVFGGDAIDRGPAGRRVVAALLEVKRRQPGQVVLLAGNRDINKMRLATELTGQPPPGCPAAVAGGPRGELLRWILSNTMGAKQAFDHRAAELAAAGLAEEAASRQRSGKSPERNNSDSQASRIDDVNVVDSYLEDLAPSGSLTEYLCACQLAHREGATLFVHGGVTRDSFGHVPDARPVDNVDDWVAGLNDFYARQSAAFRARERGGYARLIEYQAPLAGTRLNQTSVVYGRPTDDLGNPVLPAAETIASLRRSGVERVVLGHTPSGDCPAVLRDGEGFEVVLADNSYGRVERGSQLYLDEDPRVVGATVLDGSDAVEVVRFGLARETDASPLGQRDAAGRLVKARLERGDYLVFRSFVGYRIEQSAVAAEALPRPLSPPR